MNLLQPAREEGYPMSRKKHVPRLSLLVAVALMLFVGRQLAFAGTINITASTAGGTKGFLYLTLRAAADYVEQKSGGKVKFTFYTNGSLLKYRQTYRGVVDGVADIANVIIGLYPGQFPKSGVLELTPGYASGVKNGKDNAYLVKNYLLDEWKEVKVLYASSVPGNNLITAKKPVYRLSDVKGIRIRASGIGPKVAKAWGGVPVSMGTGEMYEALQKGLVDGTITNESGFISLKLADVCRYSNQIYATQNAAITIMNLKKYQSLPVEIRKIFDQLMDWIPEVGGRISETQSEKGRKALLAAGGKIITYSPQEKSKFIDAMKSINREWAEGLEAKGLPGLELLKARNKLLGVE